MPRYEYKCRECDASFEVVHGIHDTVESCEKCGGKVRRVFHPVGIVFKGSGFYATDSKRPDNKPSIPESEKETAASGEGNGKKQAEDKGDKKPDKKPDSSVKSTS